MTESPHDIIVIGGGPAGLTAGVYSSRELLKTLILEKGVCGGWPTRTELIENYPGFPDGINGVDLAGRFIRQARRFGAEIAEASETTGIVPEGDLFLVRSGGGEFRGRAVVVASGSREKPLGIPGEETFLGQGVSYCATCDGPLYRNKEVAVIGGGNTALAEARSLARFASRVHLLHRREEFRGARILEEELRKNGKISFVRNALPLAIEGARSVESLSYRDKITGEERKIALSGVFIFVGLEPNSAFVKGLVDRDEAGYITTDGMMRTSRPGIFAAGDVRAGNVRQISAAVGEGTVAALSARDYLNRTSAKKI